MNPSRVWFLSLAGRGQRGRRGLSRSGAGAAALLAQRKLSVGLCVRRRRILSPPAGRQRPRRRPSGKQEAGRGVRRRGRVHHPQLRRRRLLRHRLRRCLHRLQPSRKRRQLRRDRPRTTLRPRRLRHAARQQLRHHRALRRRRAVPALRRHHGLRRRSLREGQQHLLPRSALRRSRVLRAAAAGLSCAPFMCRPDGKACADRCGGATDCVSPNTCSNGSCGTIGNGLPCRNAGQCQSGFCVDGVCCNAPCTEQCMACDLTASLGTCAQVVAGNPHGARGTCAGAGTTCAGQCTAASATACSYPGGESICRSATCTNGAANASQTSAAGCDGAGSCSAGVATACGIYMCAAGGVCATTCAGDFDCAAGYICQGGACQAKGAAAAPCTATSQCAGGLTCKDGVCCESACADPCRGCNLGGQAGHCVVVASADDPDSCPADTRTCNAGGACTSGTSRPARPPPTARAERARPSIPTRTATRSAIAARRSPTARRSRFGAAGAGWVTSNSDCCDAGDTDRAVHPGQTGWFTAAGPCGSSSTTTATA